METSSLVSEYPQKINVDQLETVIMLVDSNYHILDMNRSAQKMFAVGDSRRRNCTLGNILPYPQRLQEIIDIAIRNSSVIVERELDIQFALITRKSLIVLSLQLLFQGTSWVAVLSKLVIKNLFRK